MLIALLNPNTKTCDEIYLITFFRELHLNVRKISHFSKNKKSEDKKEMKINYDEIEEDFAELELNVKKMAIVNEIMLENYLYISTDKLTDNNLKAFCLEHDKKNLALLSSIVDDYATKAKACIDSINLIIGEKVGA